MARPGALSMEWSYMTGKNDSHEAWLTGLLRIGGAIRDSHDPGEVLDAILASAIDTFRAERGFLAFVDAKGELALQKTHGLDPSGENKLSEVSRSAMDKALATGETGVLPGIVGHYP